MRFRIFHWIRISIWFRENLHRRKISSTEFCLLMWRTILSSFETYEIILVINQWFNRQINKKTNTWKLIESMFNSPERNYHCGNSKNYYHQEQAPYWNINCFAQTQTSLTKILIKKWLQTIVDLKLFTTKCLFVTYYMSHMVCDIPFVTLPMWHVYLVISFDLNLESIESVLNLNVFNIFTDTGKSPPSFTVRLTQF